MAIVDTDQTENGTFSDFFVNGTYVKKDNLPERFYPFVYNHGANKGYKGVMVRPVETTDDGCVVGFSSKGNSPGISANISVLPDHNIRHEINDNLNRGLSALVTFLKRVPGEVIMRNALPDALKETPGANFDEMLYIDPTSGWKVIDSFHNNGGKSSVNRLVIIDSQGSAINVEKRYKVPEHGQITFVGFNGDEAMASTLALNLKTASGHPVIDCGNGNCRFYNINFQWKQQEKAGAQLLLAGVDTFAGTFDLFSMGKSGMTEMPSLRSSSAMISLFAKNRYKTETLERWYDTPGMANKEDREKHDKEEMETTVNMWEQSLSRGHSLSTGTWSFLLSLMTLPGVAGMGGANATATITGQPLYYVAYGMLGFSYVVIGFMGYTLIDAICAICGHTRFSYTYRLAQCAKGISKCCHLNTPRARSHEAGLELLPLGGKVLEKNNRKHPLAESETQV